MGSELYTYEQAAARLGRSVRAVQYYVRDGLIKKERRNGKTFLNAEDVEQLIIDRNADHPSLNRQAFFELSTRVRKLEEGMALLQRALEIHDKPLKVNKDEALSFYQAAGRYLAAGKWDVADIKLWVGLFEGMDEAFFEMIWNASGNAKPWDIFFRLCMAMQQYVGRQQPQDLAVQAWGDRLSLCRNKLRACILAWVEMGRGTVPKDVFQELDGRQSALMRQLAGKTAKGPGASA